MTAEVVNLRRVRKVKAREDRVAEADANRARHGLTSVERETQVLAAERLSRTLDNHRLDNHRLGAPRVLPSDDA